MHKFKVRASLEVYLSRDICFTKSNFNATILKFSEKFDHPFSFVFIFGSMLLESHGFVTMPVPSCMKDRC